jgi:hypothetical protein
MSENISGLVPWLCLKVEAIWKSFVLYPINIQYVQQFETNLGYVFVVNIQTTCRQPISINKDRFKVRIQKDTELIKKVDNDKILYGESVEIFDSKELLDAKIRGLSVGNVANHIWLENKSNNYFFLLRVQGPGSSNPSSRLQLAKVYRSMKIMVKKWFWFSYIEIPLRHITFIAGNEKTKIIDK